jgi:sulfatase modifying factor 1
MFQRHHSYLSLLALLIVVNCQGESEIDKSAVTADQQRKSAGRTNPIDGAELVSIPGGEFLMGSDPDELERIWQRFNWDIAEIQFTKSEQPAHRVQVDGFVLYRKLVSVVQYRKFSELTKRAMPPAPSYGWTDTHPMVHVSWDDAKAYCTWSGGRLPYEAEWEYAARGGQNGVDGTRRTVFVWGDELPKVRVANLADESFKQGRDYNSNFHLFAGYNDGYPHTSPVDAFPPNNYGLYDMAGNVLEWCADWFADDYYRNSPKSNPRGPGVGVRRVLRGGAFDTIPTITRISRRLGNFPDIRHDEKGFRCLVGR